MTNLPIAKTIEHNFKEPLFDFCLDDQYATEKISLYFIPLGKKDYYGNVTYGRCSFDRGDNKRIIRRSPGFFQVYNYEDDELISAVDIQKTDMDKGMEDYFIIAYSSTKELSGMDLWPEEDF